MKTLLKNIIHIIEKHKDTQVEIEYLKDYPKSIDIRVYEGDVFDEFHDENYSEHAEEISKEINETLSHNFLKTEVYTPHPDTVKFGFSGINFKGISLTLKDNIKYPYDYYVIIDEGETYRIN